MSPLASAASHTVCSTQPACTLIVPPSVSISSILFMRSSDSAMWPSASPPSTSPVLPPQGTTPSPAAWQSFSALDTSSVLAGRSTAAGTPSLLQPPAAFSSASLPVSTP